MNPPPELLLMTASDLAAGLGEAGIGDGWVVARAVRARAQINPQSLALEEHEPLNAPSQGFQNLVAGRIAELVFRTQHLTPLEQEGFVVKDLHEAGENRDYVLERDGLELPINVKTASTMFRNARQVVGLDPRDCIPISAYKAIGATERVPDLVYVDLVDFTLREKVDAFMDGLHGSEGTLWHLFSWYGGAGARRAQDAYIARLFALHGAQLVALAPGVSSWRVISAQRVLAVMREMPRRCPGLGVPAAGRGVFNAEVNIHVSVERETVPWDAAVEIIRRDGIAAVLEGIRRQEIREVRAPTI